MRVGGEGMGTRVGGEVGCRGHSWIHSSTRCFT